MPDIDMQIKRSHRIFIIAVTVFFGMLLAFSANVSAAEAEFNSDGTSHLYWPFTVKNSKNIWTPNFGSGHGDDFHTGADHYAEDWNTGIYNKQGVLDNDKDKDCGTDFLAPMSGQVIYVNKTSNVEYGRQVIIQSDLDPEFAFRVAHLLEKSNDFIQLGQKIHVGDKIGEVGSSGRSSGCHAHIVLYKNLGDTELTKLRTGAKPGGEEFAAPFSLDGNSVASCPQGVFRGEFFDNKTLTGDPVFSACYQDIDFDWGSRSPYQDKIGKENFSARFTQELPLRYGNYEFSTRSDDGVRLFLDESTVIDDWNTHAVTANASSRVVYNGTHNIRLEYFEDFDLAELQLDLQLINPLNNPPTIFPPIPNQSILVGETFTSFDLDDYVFDVDLGDAETLAWSGSGNLQLQVNISEENIVTVTAPIGFTGYEELEFVVTDWLGGTDSQIVRFNVEEFAVPTWVDGTDIPSPKEHMSMTELDPGIFLVAGGYNSLVPEYSRSSYIYDANDDSWTRVGDMVYERKGHTATKLPDGRVFAAGGYRSGHLATAEIFNPATGEWQAVLSMDTARYSHTASLLPSGEVMIVGGFAPGSYDTPTEVYNPNTNSWRVVASPNFGRGEHTATTLADGRVLIAGGYRGTVINRVEIFDPLSETWQLKTSMLQARTRHTATLLPDGRILFAGGWIGNMINSAEIYNPTTNTTTWIANMPSPHSDHQAQLIGNKVYIVAGSPANGATTNKVEAFDLNSMSWSSMPSLQNPMVFHQTTVLNDKYLLVVGGSPSSVSTLDNVEILKGI